MLLMQAIAGRGAEYVVRNRGGHLRMQRKHSCHVAADSASKSEIRLILMSGPTFVRVCDETSPVLAVRHKGCREPDSSQINHSMARVND